MKNLKPKLTVYTGGMFASKSTALVAKGQRHILAGHKVAFIKPSMDNRYGTDEIVTHDGQSVQAISVDVNDAILGIPEVSEADVILIDEAQFFSTLNELDIRMLLKRGKVIYVAGLDMDWGGSPFKLMTHLMGIAHEVQKFQAVCSECGDDGYVTAKTKKSNVRVEIGSKDIYKPVCLDCYNNLKEEF